MNKEVITSLGRSGCHLRDRLPPAPLPISPFPHRKPPSRRWNGRLKQRQLRLHESGTDGRVTMVDVDGRTDGHAFHHFAWIMDLHILDRDED